jgi:hypothetical protein
LNALTFGNQKSILCFSSAGHTLGSAKLKK